METFVGIGLERLQARHSEINLILSEAESRQDEEKIYKALCRSAQVLTVAHLEGSIKDLVKALLNDISYNRKFIKVPLFIKRVFVEHYMQSDESGKYHEHIRTRIIKLFDSLNPSLTEKPFLFENNKNPKSSIIEKIMTRFDISTFFERIDPSDLNIVFSGTNSELIELRDRLLTEIRKGVTEFPYFVSMSAFNILEDCNLEKKTTLWHTFLEEVLNSRHEIAHGNNISTSMSGSDIKKNALKVQILMYTLILVLCHKVSSITTE